MKQVQSIKKGAGQKSASSGVAALKTKLGINKNIANKSLSWITMPPAFMEALRIPGFPQGYVTSIIGHSNTGKSTLINHAISEAQRQGILPVIIDTETSFDFSYAMSMGFKATPVYADIDETTIDPETGEEVTKTVTKVMSYDGDFVYVNSDMLAEMYSDNDYATGKKVASSKKRDVAVIEDVAQLVNDILDAQANGEIEMPILFIWDSVNSVGSWQGYSADKKENNMWNAGALEVAFKTIFNQRIPGSKNIDKPYTNTFIMVQKVSTETTPTGIVTAKGKGGKEMKYVARLQIFLGGAKSSNTKSLKAVSKGISYVYGTETKAHIPKTQLPSPYDISSEGSFVCTSTGIIKVSEVDEYRKKNLPTILKMLNKISNDTNSGLNISSEDVIFQETENND